MLERKVTICGVDTSRLRVIPHKEMTELIKKINKGDLEARQTAIQGNLKLVLSLIKRFYNRGESPDDLFQVGCIGLIKSIDNFDLKHKVRFSTYAVPMIIGEIRRYLRDNNSIRVSRSIRDTAYKALKARDKLTIQLKREPTVVELAGEMDEELSKVVFAINSIQDTLSLSEPVYSNGGDEIYLQEQIKDTKSLPIRWENHLAIRQAIDRLNERERKILNLRFFNSKTQIEVAKEIGISQAQVSRIEKSALKKMKKEI